MVRIGREKHIIFVFWRLYSLLCNNSVIFFCDSLFGGNNWEFSLH